MKTQSKTRKKAQPATRPSTPHDHSSSEAHSHYHREKARRAALPPQESEALAAARREYVAQLEAQAAKGKGGRPKKKPAAAPVRSVLEDDLVDE
jgi:hypothetical protein